MLFDRHGNRKYLTPRERSAFMRLARRSAPELGTLCLTLALTGARISEVLALTPARIDHENGLIIFETLKRRRRGIFRAVPVPDYLLSRLRIAHDHSASNERLWPRCRTTYWEQIKRVMLAAGIDPARAMPRALRHTFAVYALTNAGIPLNLVQKWLGHARIQTTAIYAEASGPEERGIASKMW